MKIKVRRAGHIWGHICSGVIAAALCAATGMPSPAMASSPGVVSASLNHLQLEFDANSGCLLRMQHPGSGEVLRSDSANASALDTAYPVPAFEPLRFGARFSTNAKVTATSSSVCVRWQRLGASREKWRDAANIGAEIVFEAAADGRSIIAHCEVENRSTSAVRQIIFPDFSGVLPFAGARHTVFRTCGGASLPFVELPPDEARLSNQFCLDGAAGTVEHRSGGIFQSMWLRWMDLGGLSGGISVFPRQWGWDPPVVLRLHHSPTEQKLRMLWTHNLSLAPGGKWKSPEYVITPHEGGWARGIEPYREWVREHYHPRYPMPQRIREALGVRTIWMTQGFPEDPNDAVFTAKDLPQLAQESREHGLAEMVGWAWTPGFTLPVPPPHSNLGTAAEFKAAVAECQRIGAPFVPFISVVLAAKDTAARYGLAVPESGGWTQHTETIPQFQPLYSSLLSCVQLGPANPRWQDEVLTSVRAMLASGFHSISWDQFWNERSDNNMLHLAEKIKETIRAADPEGSLSGEELWNMELDCELLDYTWNWLHERDCSAFLSVFPAPRINWCISHDPGTVRRAFMDNRLLNIFPRKPGNVNGSDWIRSHPELSRTLRQCAALRRQFLDYFTSGTIIGQCMLTTPCEDARVNAYVRDARALMIVLNSSAPDQELVLRWDPGAWLTGKGPLNVTRYDMSGHKLSETRCRRAVQKLKIKGLPKDELTIFEIVSTSE